MLQDIHKRALRLAAELSAVMKSLGFNSDVSEVEFVSWFGKRDLPRDIFLLVDIITKEQVRDVRSYRAPRKVLAGK